MIPTTREDIDDFLSQARIAMVGVSRDSKDFSRALFRELLGRGYDMVPVNPLATEIEGCKCFERLRLIEPQVDGVLVMTPPEETRRVVVECADSGVSRVWMHRGAGKGAVDDAAIDFCRRNNIRVVAGHCPFMFLPKTPFFHRLHGFFKRLGGHYPVQAAVHRM